MTMTPIPHVEIPGSDYILFFEYFDIDNGAGLGASPQTRWPNLIARILDLFARLEPGGCIVGVEGSHRGNDGRASSGEWLFQKGSRQTLFPTKRDEICIAHANVIPI